MQSRAPRLQSGRERVRFNYRRIASGAGGRDRFDVAVRPDRQGLSTRGPSDEYGVCPAAGSRDKQAARFAEWYEDGSHTALSPHAPAYSNFL